MRCAKSLDSYEYFEYSMRMRSDAKEELVFASFRL
jgi:hypothetical protein